MIIGKREVLLEAEKWGDSSNIPVKCSKCGNVQTLKQVLNDEYFERDISDIVTGNVLNFEDFLGLCFNCGYQETVPPKSGVMVENSDNTLKGIFKFVE